MSKELKIELWPVENLIPYDLNAKKHEKDQVARIVESIRRFGWDQPIVVDREGVIIKGHGRRLAALELGLGKVPVLMRADLTPEQVRAARLSDNRAAISDIDPELLRAELSTLDADLVGIFDAKELDFMSADLGTMNTDVFVTDMDAVLSEQREDLDARIKGAKSPEARVTVAKALGFADVPADGLIYITELVAKAETSTGLSKGDAFVKYIRSLSEVNND